MLAEPGSGKSFFIKCLAQNMASTGASAVDYNMANMRSVDDLIQPLEAVRNLKVVDRLPILFLDEFDSSPDNFSRLLSLLWDGELHVGHRDLKLGKVVIIMAGSDPLINKVMKTTKSMQKESVGDEPDKSDGKSTKLADLLSRINGGVFEIPELDAVTRYRNRQVDKVCITISLIQQRFSSKVQLIPWCLLKFVAHSKFRYGVRSIAHLVDLIPKEKDDTDRLVVQELKLPLSSDKKLENSSLAYHLIAEKGPESVVETWNAISSCITLVRFKPIVKEVDI